MALTEPFYTTVLASKIMTPILQIDKLAKSYGAVKVADDLTLSVQPGEALGVIGPNGAGKTSMFNLITGTVSPSSGSITFSVRT